MSPKYSASLSKNEGRESWAIIFRHPVRKAKDGKTGLRVRRGLGTSDKVEAQRLVDQMNVLLQDEKYWTPASRIRAEKQFPEQIVSAFYDSMEPQQLDHWKNRDEVIFLPSHADGYSRAMFIGTTGAGKTTLVRQLLGSDPTKDRFPSTSAAKTTTCDIEIVLREGAYEAVVSFLPREMVRQYIEECVTNAVFAATDGESIREVARLFLTHREQRFRLSYIIGNPALDRISMIGTTESNNLEDDLEDEGETIAIEKNEDQISIQERLKNEDRATYYLEQIYALAEMAKGFRQELNQELGDGNEHSGEDREAFEELVEDQLHETSPFNCLVDNILDDVETRFDLIKEGSFKREKTGWPITWSFKSSDRQAFLGQVNWFSSNYAGYFGRLLTPVVQGLRVAGEFCPAWHRGDFPRLVLIDGEGMGHTPDSASSLPTEVTRRYELVDAIVLVDKADQPFQAAPSAAIRSVAARGYESKILLAFTHFEDVKGINFANVQAKRDHVLSSMDNCLGKLREVLPGIEKNVRQHLIKHTYFLSRIQEPLGESAKGTRLEISRLLQAIQLLGEPEAVGEAVPYYDEPHLVICVHKAIQHFHEVWNAILGLATAPGIQKEHWARVKALSRRYAERMGDEYLWLRPVADISQFLSERIRDFLEAPLVWKPANATDDERKGRVERISQEVSKRLQEYAGVRLYINPVQEWNDAYFGHSGPGSTFWRARDIQSIYLTEAPIPAEAPTPSSNAFLRRVLNLIRDGIAAGGGKLMER